MTSIIPCGNHGQLLWSPSSFKSMTGARCSEGKIGKEGIKMGSREGTIQGLDVSAVTMC